MQALDIKITQAHLDAAHRSFTDRQYPHADLVNKAIEIALAEQSQEQPLIKTNPLTSLPDELIDPRAKKALGEWIDSQQTEPQTEWVKIEGVDHDPRYPQVLKVEPHAELKAIYKQQAKDGTLDDFVWTVTYPNGNTSLIQNLPKEWHPAWLPNRTYHCTPKPTCQIRNEDTGELKTMTREAAKKLQAETKDKVVWTDPEGCPPVLKDGFNFTQEGIYAYKLRPLKQINWRDVPVGVMTNKGELRKVIYTRHADGARMQVETNQNASTANVSEFYSDKDLELAPADQQPWLNWRGGECPVPEGVMVEVTLRENSMSYPNKPHALDWKHSGHAADIIEYRITGIAKGYKLWTV